MDVTKLTSFKIGGEIENIHFPSSVEEFVGILKEYPDAKVFGNLSNTLVSSFGFDGVVIVTTNMNNVKVEGNKVVAECGIKGPKLSQIAQENGLSGFEFMIGFPGSLGGNICMNASAHNQCISDKLTSVKCFSNGEIKDFSKDEMEFSYRKSICAEKNLVVLSAEFELDFAPKYKIQAKMDENLDFRKNHQPSLALPNCGSVFKNPEGNSAGRLLELSGAKEMKSGGVCVWAQHANFIINQNNGTSTDVLTLMYKMSKAVEEKFGIKLTPEVKYLGKNEKELELWSKIK